LNDYAVTFYFIDTRHVGNLYSIVVNVSSAATQSFDIYMRAGNLPSAFPNATVGLNINSMYPYHVFSTNGVATLEANYLNGMYPWYIGVSGMSTTRQSFTISISYSFCYNECGGNGHCDVQKTVCNCNSGWTGSACQTSTGGGSHTGLILGLVFGLFLPLAIVLGIAAFWYFDRRRQGYELINQGRE